MNTFLSYVLKGILALLPIIILLWILSILYSWISKIIFYVFSSVQGSVISTIIICALVLVFLFSLGFVVQKHKNTIFLKITELIIGKIPLVSSIYATLKEVVNLFSGGNKENYLGVAYVKINDYKLLGFITKELEDSYWVFVPTTPNPTSGFLINAKKDSVEMSDLSVAQGFKRLISLGIK